jgi:hypothetical protein
MVLSRLVFQHLGWGVAASVTPAVMGITGAVFFATTVFGTGFLGTWLGPQATVAMVGVGSVAGIMTQVGGRVEARMGVRGVSLRGGVVWVQRWGQGLNLIWTARA